MSKRISRLASSVQNPPAYWRDKSATFTVLPNQGERHCSLIRVSAILHLSLNSWRPG